MVYKTADKRKTLIALTAIGVFIVSFCTAIAIMYFLF